MSIPIVRPWVRKRWVFALLAAVCVAAASAVWLASRTLARRDPRLAAAVRRDFDEIIRCRGGLKPVGKLSLYPQVRGTIQKIVQDGARVQEGEVVLQLDPKPHEEALAQQDAKLRRLRAEKEKALQTLSKDLYKAKGEIESRVLRAELESLRLKDMELGPTATDELNASVALANAKTLLEARKEEYAILSSLGQSGFVAQSEVRQKALEMSEQEFKVTEADIKYQKLHIPDPIQMAVQRLLVRDEEKNRDSARERAGLLERNLHRTEEKFVLDLKREEKRREELADNIGKTRLVAAAPGAAILNKPWGIPWGPGRDVGENNEVMNLSDLRKMKALLTVDEGRVVRIQKGQRVLVHPVGISGLTYSGSVVRIAEKGKDEFEDYLPQTKDIAGRANRQMFVVEVEIEGEASRLRPGQLVEGQIIIQRLPQALVVPRSAVVRENGAEPFVRLETLLGIERRPVKVQAEDELFCALAGIEDGDRVWLVEP